MRSELKKGVKFGNVENATNELIIFFDEDLFNDAEYKDGKKKDELIAQAKAIIDANLQDLKPVEIVYNNIQMKNSTKLTFNITGVPDAKFVKGYNGVLDLPANDAVFSIFVEITVYAAEQVLGVKLERKGRKWFRKPGAPAPSVEAEGCAEGVIQAIQNDGCWGCKGIGVHTGVDSIDNPTACPISF